MPYNLKNNSNVSIPIYDGYKTLLLLPGRTMTVEALTPMMTLFSGKGMFVLSVPKPTPAPVSKTPVPTPRRVANPKILPASGSYIGSKVVTMTCASSGSVIRYTLDGSNPSETKGIIYSVPLTISASRTIKAVAYKTDWLDSFVTSSSYNITIPVVDNPIILPGAGNYSDEQLVTITCATSGSSIRYTLDGSSPSETVGTVYTESFSVSSNQTVKAIAYKSDFTSSSVVSSVYTITIPGTVASPMFSPVGGTYNEDQNITISCSTPGSEIRYTIDGTDPSESVGTIYSEPFIINSNQTLKAIAYKSGDISSSVVFEEYIIPIMLSVDGYGLVVDDIDGESNFVLKIA